MTEMKERCISFEKVSARNDTVSPDKMGNDMKRREVSS